MARQKKIIDVKLVLMGKGVHEYEVVSGTTIGEFLTENDIDAEGELQLDNQEVTLATAMLHDCTLMVVPKVRGA